MPNPLAPLALPRPYNPSADFWRLSPNRTLTSLRRDTTMLPAFGWLALAFQTTYPGACVFHCHIAWHSSQGLSVQFLERAADIASAMDLSGALTKNCAAWSSYEPHDPFQKTDSGL